jgi:hypothetical protein
VLVWRLISRMRSAMREMIATAPLVQDCTARI